MPLVRLMSPAEMEAEPPYTPMLLNVRGGTAKTLAHKSPNGMWWSTYQNPTSAEDLWALSDKDGVFILTPMEGK